jgi:excisionase family DNA binding protein
MLTVPEAARRIGRNPETVRRWIRQGRLRATKVGTQHVIDETALEAIVAESTRMPMPSEWRTTFWGSTMPDVVGAVRRTRSEH